MEEKLGTEQIKKGMLLILALSSVGDYIVHHPELGPARFAKLTDVFDELMAMSTFDFVKLKAEYKDLDEVEKAELSKLFKEKFDIENDALEAKIEHGFDLIAKGYGLVQELLGFVKSFKKEVLA